ncbi:MAG: dTDP-4-dehydrorhamnose 3,5-epimerase [Syntrophobacteraceae bacterium CG2_30_61_12]|nr:MAG: dTDP-4-dehydrorhamnose 3,5-epimerase [Syntrophobacteraceae bacterium CG2_30_61_12]
MMKVTESSIPGCYEIISRVFRDNRGTFVKTFHHDMFLEHGLTTQWREEYYSVSHHGVLRGLHFQLPPHDHEKLVYCIAGRVLDAVVDLRKGSPTFGRHVLLELDAGKANMLYVPRGLAHGFYVLSDSAILIYKASSVHAPEHDTGIHWNTAGISWPDKTPLTSPRDNQFSSLDCLDSPFIFHQGQATGKRRNRSTAGIGTDNAYR